MLLQVHVRKDTVCPTVFRFNMGVWVQKSVNDFSLIFWVSLWDPYLLLRERAMLNFLRNEDHIYKAEIASTRSARKIVLLTNTSKKLCKLLHFSSYKIYNIKSKYAQII